MQHSIGIFFILVQNWHSLYIRVKKLSLLRFYFSFRSNWAFCWVKEDYKISRSLAIVRIVRFWTIATWKIQIILDRWDHKIVRSRSDFDNYAWVYFLKLEYVRLEIHKAKKPPHQQVELKFYMELEL